MLPRLAAPALAVLLLLAQFASSAMQMCIEQDGSITMEVTGRDCGPFSFAKDIGFSSNQEWTPFVGSTFSLRLSENDCPCVDFGLALIHRGSKDYSVTCRDLLRIYSAELPSAMAPSPVSLLSCRAPASGQQATSWLEQQDLLAKKHAAHTIVMRC